VFRTVKVKLPFENSLLQTAVAFNRACQMALDYGSPHKTYNKDKLNKATYHQVREAIPTLPSALVQTARDEASEILLRTDFAKIVKKRLSVRYDNRCFKFYPQSNYVSLTTVHGRLNFPFEHFAYLDTWKGEYTNAQLIVRKNTVFLNVQVKMPDVPLKVTGKVLGVDRGVLNIAVCSDNTFFDSKRLRAVKGRYHYLRRRLQHVGTRSAYRKLRRLSGCERRFVLNANHRISKAIVNKPFDVFALEKLHIIREKRNGKRFNRLLGSWSPDELYRFIAYKAEAKGKVVVEVNPRHTSQRCSRCGFVHRWNRHGLRFRCGNCGFELNADLNASRNIEVLGMSERLRLFVNEPIVASSEASPTGVVDGSYKPVLQDGVVDTSPSSFFSFQKGE
jgi:putative transposase